MERTFVNYSVYKFALLESVKKLSPHKHIHNPVLLIVWMVGMLTLVITILSAFGFELQGEPIWFCATISISIWMIILFSNFVEAIASYNEEKLGHKFFCEGELNTVRIIDGDNATIKSANNVVVGNVIEVRAGEIIPCDGVVVFGAALVDEAAITGESAPVIRDTREGRNEVQPGTKVISDFIRIKIIHDQSKSVVAKIRERISKSERKESENNKSLSTLIFTYSLIYIVMCLGLYIIGLQLNLPITVIELAALLVCIMPTTIAGLLSPIGISAIERLMRRNIVPYTQDAIESAGDIDVIVFDKTGTITEGNRKAVKMQCFKGEQKEFYEAVELASIMDETIEGKSIIELLAKGIGFKGEPIKFNKFTNIPFSAVTKMSGCVYKGDQYLKGSIDAIRNEIAKNGDQFPTQAQEFCRNAGMNGSTPILVMKNGEVLGGIELSDKVKPGIAPRISRLNHMGYRVLMLTGDNYYTTKTIAESIGINDFICEADPDRKLDYVKKLQEEGNIVAFIGDGANDAASISTTEVGFVMSNAPAVSIEAANIIDFDNDPTKIIEVIEIGRETLMTRGCLTTFSFLSEFSKYIAIVPVMFEPILGDKLDVNLLDLHSPYTAILSSVIFNALVLLLMMPVALKGVKYKPRKSITLAKKFFAVFGVGGMVLPLIGIKAIDLLIVSLLGLA